MTQPTVCLVTLCLNEAEWLPKLYEQHKNWPGLREWVFVEAADMVYAEANPTMVTTISCPSRQSGLSVDGTTEFLERLALDDDRVVHIKHGVSSHPVNPSQGKCQARQRYLDRIEAVKPAYLVQIDGDEFHMRQDQARIVGVMDRHREYDAFSYPQVNIWRPPSVAIAWPLFSHEVKGGFWSIPHTRAWRWQKGLRYRDNHNCPETSDGQSIEKRLLRVPGPACVHMGFASDGKGRAAKHRYYQARGEGRLDHRGWYVDSRRAWETWGPGVELPSGATVSPYSGPIPECFGNQEAGGSHAAPL